MNLNPNSVRPSYQRLIVAVSLFGVVSGSVALAKPAQVFFRPDAKAKPAVQTTPTVPTTPIVPGEQLVTGKRITPQGQQTDVGSFPANMIVSRDGHYLLVTNVGMREYLSVLRVSDGQLVSRLDWNDPSTIYKKKKKALYYGLICGPTVGGTTPVYAAPTAPCRF